MHESVFEGWWFCSFLNTSRFLYYRLRTEPRWFYHSREPLDSSYIQLIQYHHLLALQELCCWWDSMFIITLWLEVKPKDSRFVGPFLLSAGHASSGTCSVFSLFRNWAVFEVSCWVFLSCWSKFSSPLPARNLQSSPRTGCSHWLPSLPGRESLYSGWLSPAWRRVLARVRHGCFLCFSAYILLPLVLFCA